jgi:hypothetical protein
MIGDIETHTQNMKSNTKSEKQEKNWITVEEIAEKVDEYKKYFDLLSKKSSLPMNKLQTCQDYILLCLTTGYYMPPRRSLDWSEMLIDNFDETEDNVYHDGRFMFNVYKTVKKFGPQLLEPPDALREILDKWVSMNPGSDYLLFDRNLNKLTPVKICQRLNKIFGKNVSVSMLRHVFITTEFDDGVTVDMLRKNSIAMAHSLQTHLDYVKN